MPYTLRFSDETKTDEIIIPDMPPGINTVDTSLSLVGKNYPNYGEKIASNFLYLLENFAGPIPPENPIEGQLWYDTSDPNNKILRIMDGTASSARWPAVNRIYQQTEDPKLLVTASLKNGDIWVDTANNQLKFFTNGAWTLVGPSITSGGAKTGPMSSFILDNSTPGTQHPVILNYVNDIIVSIISSDNEFIPKVVINGFNSIKPGINLPNLNNDVIILHGTSEKALKLDVNNIAYSGDRFLRKDDPTANGQIITGKILFKTPANQAGSQGRDGVVVITSSENDQTNYVQFYKLGNDAILLNNKAAGKIIFQTKPSSNTGLVDTLTIEHRSVGINTTTNSFSPALDVNGSVKITESLLLVSTSTTSLNVFGGGIVQKSFTVTEHLSVVGESTMTGLISVGSSSGSGTIINPNRHDTYDLGSSTKYFRNLYVSNIVGAGTSRPGMIVAYGSNIAPMGWLLCNGSEYSTTIYSTLYSVIGYTYGGSGSTFNVPNFSATAGGAPIYYIIKT